MAKLSRLLSPIRIGSMELSNRICMGELGPNGDGKGCPSQRTIDFYAARAKGGAGLIIVGGSYPSRNGATSRWGTWFFEDAVIPGWARLVKALRQANPEMKIGVQLLHCGRQMHVHAEGAFGDNKPVAPSAISYQFGIVPHELTTKEVGEVVEEYVEATRRAQEAGFDCINLHGAHGYLISQFISPYSNRRTDRYGGSVENRARFACEIIEGIKKRCGRNFPVLIKINCRDYVNAPEQIDLEHTKAVVPFLESAGADEIHISGGQHESYIAVPVSPYTIPRAFFAEETGEIRKVARVPIGASCRINDLELAEKLLGEGKADLIWMARPFMSDAEFPNKAKEGRLDEIRTCIACCTCIDMLWDDWMREWRCAINPETMRETMLPMVPTVNPKKVLVIGGGPAGCEAGCVAAEGGHRVTLWEKEARLGGQVNLTTAIASKYEYRNIPRYYHARLKALGVSVEMNREATVERVKEFNPDVVILATGSLMERPSLPGVNGSGVVFATDVIEGKVKAGGRVVVIGGGVVGMETAELLSEQGKRVVMVVRSKLGRGMVRMIYHILRGKLEKAGVEILTKTRTLGMDASGVRVMLPGGEERRIEADTVVLATGSRGNRSLLDGLEGVVTEIHVIGDALKPRNIMTAIYQGAMVGRALDNYHPKKWKQ
jgi:2,4-dienoyl-CoA reductase-like NADH-dependent reductase (Old Yellow Enzyme family)/thioredoxin reductase